MKYKPGYKYIPPITWSILTPLYDFLCVISGLGTAFKKKVLNATRLRGGMTVVDIGCGTGVFLKIAKQRYPAVNFIGLDPDRHALAIAKRRLSKNHLSVELKESFAESLPLAHQSVDICFSMLTFHHMPDTVKRDAVMEIYRVLKDNGKVVIGDFGARKHSLLQIILFFKKIEYIDGNLQGLIPRFLSETGFKNIKIVGHHFPAVDIIIAEK